MLVLGLSRSREILGARLGRDSKVVDEASQPPPPPHPTHPHPHLSAPYLHLQGDHDAMRPEPLIPTLTLLTFIAKVVGWLEMQCNRATSWFSREQEIY